MIELFSWEAISFASLILILFIIVYMKGKSDGEQNGINATIKFLEDKGVLSLDSDQD